MTSATRDYQLTRTRDPDRLHQGLDRVAHDLLGLVRRKKEITRKWQAEAAAIHAQSLRMQAFPAGELSGRLGELRSIFRRRARGHEQHLPEALALICEASARTLGMRPYSVQVLGALIIHRGGLAEMATGEGKSLTATLPAIIAAWGGKPCHIITANDYLASRDAEELAPLYHACGVTVGWVGSHMPTAERQKNYSCGVVYVTSKELLADFLRDRLLLGNCHQAERRHIRKKLQAWGPAERGLVMRGIDTAIVDEADSVLIDEAVTPLIISQPHANQPLTEASRTAYDIAGKLTVSADYTVDHRYRDVRLTAAGEARLESLCSALPELWHGSSRRAELVTMALVAREFYRRDRQYVIEGDKVVIVDEFTGRMMPQRTWRQGLHQMIEAKEGLPLSDPSETLVRLSFQRFFRFFRKLGGMTGTALEAAGEFWHIYGLPVLTVPTNKPCMRQQLPSRYFADEPSKWQAICDEICACHGRGQPVLVGTRSVAASERLAGLLRARNIEHRLLNAVKHREEAEIIASAGQRGRVTIATNMAGRGADIKLGPGVAELGGLHVVLSEHHESKRIDRQLFGRSGRQGDPGTARVFGSMEDELLQRLGPARLVGGLPQAVLRNGDEMRRFVKHLVSLAQHAAERLAFNQRKAVMQTDEWLTDALSFAKSDMDMSS